VKRLESIWHEGAARESIEQFGHSRNVHSAATTRPITSQAELQKLMWEGAGPFRTGGKLRAALERIMQMQRELSGLNIGVEQRFNLDLQDWFELRAMLATAEAVVKSALARTESRGAHQREDFPASDNALLKNQVLRLKDEQLATTWHDPVRLKESDSPHG